MSKEIRHKIEDALFNFYMEADKTTISDSLRDDIQNIDEYEKKKKQIIFLAKARAKKQHNDYLLDLVNKFQEALIQNVEKPVSLLKQLIQEKASPALYRNLDKLSKDDIIEIIKDKNLVELLEQLENHDKGD